MAYTTILTELADGVLTITLNRPDTLNAFNDTMIFETMAALKEAGRDKAVRCVRLTGAGRGFSSGQDLRDVPNREGTIGDHMRHTYNRLILQMVGLAKPILGAINGVAAGAGCGIALATDLRICSDQASFLQVFSKRGLVPDNGSTWLLPRLVGYARAYEMAVEAEKIGAAQALEWGLVNRVVPHEQLGEISLAWARQIAAGPTLAYGLTKRAMLKGLTMDLESALAYEAHMQDLAGASADSQEAIQAFLEKRAPTFKGH
ncbi:MAG: enoyl-CoA hydratase/isomerase family protein [Ardenticatenales bacterium]|nr:enoyl-CoA hydratase/isomerase family protein [Ardenticatenales bacterium]